MRVHYAEGGSFFYADGVLLLEDEERKRTLYCIEYYEHELVLQQYNKIRLYMQALAGGYPSKQFQHKANARVLLVFRHLSSIRLLTERLQAIEDFKSFRDLFLFTSLEKLQSEPIEDIWTDYLGERIAL